MAGLWPRSISAATSSDVNSNFLVSLQCLWKRYWKMHLAAKRWIKKKMGSKQVAGFKGWVLFQEFSGSPMGLASAWSISDRKWSAINSPVWVVRGKTYIFPGQQKINLISWLVFGVVYCIYCINLECFRIIAMMSEATAHWIQVDAVQIGKIHKCPYGFLLQIKWVIPSEWPWPQHN